MLFCVAYECALLSFGFKAAGRSQFTYCFLSPDLLSTFYQDFYVLFLHTGVKTNNSCHNNHYGYSSKHYNLGISAHQGHLICEKLQLSSVFHTNSQNLCP